MPMISATIPFTVKVNAAAIGDEAWTQVSPDCYECEAAGLRVTVERRTFENTGAVRQINTITNTGSQDVLLSGFSSAKIHTARGRIGVDRSRWVA